MYITITVVLGILFILAEYILCGLAYMKLARSREMKHSWLAWIPIVKAYLIGKVADDINGNYHQTTHRSLWMLILSIATFIMVFVSGAAFLFSPAADVISQITPDMDTQTIQQLAAGISSSDMRPFLISTAITGILAIVMIIFLFIAWYAVFREYAPNSAGIYLIITLLCVILLGVTFVAPILILMISKNTPQFVELNSKRSYDPNKLF